MPGAAAPQFRHADVVRLIVEAELASQVFGATMRDESLLCRFITYASPDLS